MELLSGPVAPTFVSLTVFNDSFFISFLFHSICSPSTSSPKKQLPYFPAELWIMILNNCESFQDIVNAIIAVPRFEVLEGAPKIFMILYVKLRFHYFFCR